MRCMVTCRSIYLPQINCNKLAYVEHLHRQRQSCAAASSVTPTDNLPSVRTNKVLDLNFPKLNAQQNLTVFPRKL